MLRTNAFSMLEKLRKHLLEDTESLKFLDDKEQALRVAINATKLKDFPEVRLIVEDAEKRINAINTLLANQYELDEITRKSLLHERDCHEFYLSRFSVEAAIKTVKSLEAYLDKQLKIFEKK